jgi:hypothetical protein
MQLAELTEDLLLILPAVILVEGVIALVAWLWLGSKGSRGARVAAWIGLVTLTLWVGSAIAFVLLHILLFTFGPAAAVLGVVLVTAFMLTMPFGWAAVIRHHDRSDTRSQAGRQTGTQTGSQSR